MEQNYPVPDSPPAFVHAPSRLTTLRWWPMWMRIFSSDISARYSLEVAPSATPGNKEVVFLLGALVNNDSIGTRNSSAHWFAACCDLYCVTVSVVSQTLKWNLAICADTDKLEAIAAMNSNAKKACVHCWWLGSLIGLLDKEKKRKIWTS